MYYDNKLDITDITDIHLYSFINLNTETQYKARYQFGDKCLTDNPIVIVSEQDGNSFVLGYLVIKRFNMTLSPLYPFFNQASVLYSGKDLTPEIERIDCFKILSWEFNSVLNDKDSLRDIFDQVSAMYAEQGRTVFIWREKGNEIDYYPINTIGNTRLTNPSFSEHFAESFLEMGNAPK